MEFCCKIVWWIQCSDSVWAAWIVCSVQIGCVVWCIWSTCRQGGRGRCISSKKIWDRSRSRRRMKSRTEFSFSEYLMRICFIFWPWEIALYFPILSGNTWLMEICFRSHLELFLSENKYIISRKFKKLTAFFVAENTSPDIRTNFNLKNSRKSCLYLDSCSCLESQDY